MAWIFALIGLAMAAAGGGAIYMGWPLLPLERGWTLTISGSFFASSGVVCLALAGVMAETRRMRRSLEREFAVFRAGPAEAPPQPLPPPIAAKPAAASVTTTDTGGRSVTIGDTTFIAFEDGTIEARTPEGIRRFGSMQELRDYLREQRDDASR